MDGDRVEGVVRRADSRYLVEVRYLTVDGLEVGIVLLLDADGVDVAIAGGVGQQGDEDIFRLGIADLQIEPSGFVAAEGVQQQRISAVASESIACRSSAYRLCHRHSSRRIWCIPDSEPDSQCLYKK